jgi:Tfp pilus assembly protein PilX
MRLNERGIISILATMSLMIVVSLVVLGFAQVARREQRLSQDNQLSSQAYYAAESGINRKLKEIQDAGGVVTADNNCSEPDAVIGDPEAGVSYTCVTVDPTPSEINGTLSNEEAKMFKIDTAAALPGIKITWKVSDTNKALSGCQAGAGDIFTPSGNWNCPFGVLRYDLTAVPSTGTFTGATLQDNTQTAFVAPLRAGGVGSTNFAVSQGERYFTQCDANECTFTINNLPPAREYYFNARLMYAATSQIVIAATNGAEFVDSQVRIDATGKAQDVLRRVAVFKSLSGKSGGLEAAMIVGDGPCKQQYLTLNTDGVTPKYDPGFCSE